MKDLNNMELKVLVGLCDEFITETDGYNFNFPRTGWADTSFDNAVGYTGLTMNATKGYISQLVQKGYIEITEVEGDKYITLNKKCNDVIEYKGHYVWGLKEEK